jgi:hypothetical protein
MVRTKPAKLIPPTPDNKKDTGEKKKRKKKAQGKKVGNRT